MKIIFTLIISMLTVLSSAHAGSFELDRIDINLKSFHMESSDKFYLTEEWNEDNYGIGFTFSKPENKITSVSVGFYNNSINNISIYGLYNVEPEIFSYDDYSIKAGAGFGAVTGYEKSINAAVIPKVMFGYKNVYLNVIYIPKVKDLSPGIIGFSVSIDI